MSDSTSSSPPSLHEDSWATVAGTPSFTSLPPIFVLSTHLTLEELHDTEESLVKRGAHLTYDVSEARLVLGRVGQKKRAALELRSRGVWTEEITATSKGTSAEPPAKRRRTGSSEKDVVPEPDVVDLSTETEGEEDDGMTTRHCPGKHLKKKKKRSLSPDAGSVASTASTFNGESTDMVRVVKLEWLDRCVESRELIPIESFVVYQARITNRPPAAEASGKKPSVKDPDTKHILQRAKEDAAMRPPSSFPSSSHFLARRHKDHHDATQSQRLPPKLIHQTTSEHDETIPIPPAPDWVKNNVLYACMRSAPLHPPNEKFISQLVKIRRIRELTLDEIGVRAYSTSIAAIAAYPYEFRSPTEVLSLPGCDIKIANLFSEFKQSSTGTVAAADALDTDPVLKVLHLFSNIWGVGAKTARDFYYGRQWQDLDDIVEHGWNSLSRVQQIGLKYYDEFLAGIPRAEVEEIAKTVHRHAMLVRPESAYDGRGIDCVIVGGYRRGKEVSGDVDLVLSHRDETVTKDLVLDLVSSLEAEGWVTHTLALHMTTSNRDQQTLPFRGDDEGRHFDSLDKALVAWQDPHFDDGDGANPVDGEETNVVDQENQKQRQKKRKRNPNPHRRVDIIISPWRTVGCAVLGWSGDTTFERDLRRYAKQAHGWKFDSSGIQERSGGGQIIDLEHGGKTWEERERLVLEGLGVGWRPATERCTR